MPVSDAGAVLGTDRGRRPSPAPGARSSSTSSGRRPPFFLLRSTLRPREERASPLKERPSPCRGCRRVRHGLQPTDAVDDSAEQPSTASRASRHCRAQAARAGCQARQSGAGSGALPPSFCHRRSIPAQIREGATTSPHGSVAAQAGGGCCCPMAARCRNMRSTTAVPWVDKYYFASPR
jgi:hypothetical protein